MNEHRGLTKTGSSQRKVLFERGHPLWGAVCVNSSRRKSQGQSCRESTPDTGYALHLDLPSMQFDNVFHDGES